MNEMTYAGLAVLLPTLNEYENVSILYPQVRKAFPSADIIIVDDNSVDETRNYLVTMQKQDSHLHTILRPRRMGIGSAHLDGIKLAISMKSDLVLTMDAD